MRAGFAILIAVAMLVSFFAGQLVGAPQGTLSQMRGVPPPTHAGAPATRAATPPHSAAAGYRYLSSARAVSGAEALAAAQADALMLAEGAPPECAAWLSAGSRSLTFTAQFGQDAVIYYTFLAGKLARGERGFYVDLGANNPRVLSNTWFMDRCLGWRGLCVEADPDLAAGLRASERTCTVVNMCSAGTRSVLSFVRDTGGERTGGHVALHAGEGDIQVPCAPLHEILHMHNVTHVDFLSIDIEGNEVLALANADWDAVPIELLLAETALSNEQLELLLHDAGFWRINDIAYNDGLYVRGPRLVKDKAYDNNCRKSNYEYMAKQSQAGRACEKRSPDELLVDPQSNDLKFQRVPPKVAKLARA